MIAGALRAAVKVLRSARLATWLLAFVGAWSVAGTLVPQSSAGSDVVAKWAAAHAGLEPVVRTLGFHDAFTSPVFTACIVILALCTALCAWERTRLAVGKARILRRSAALDANALVGDHDVEIPCDPALSGDEVLARTAAKLGELGVRTKRADGVLAAVSSPWSVWGSPVFHWALFALMVALIVGNLMRASGLMGISVGETKPDAPASYGLVHAGPLYDWSRVHRSIRVDAFDPAYRSEGIDRGPTPTVSLLDAAGNVVKTQRVYPNMTLKSGTLTIYPSDFGFTTGLTLLNSKGSETGHSAQLVDFSDTKDGTSASGSLNVRDNAGNVLLSFSVTVPLDRVGGALVRRIPTQPAVRVVATGPDGAKVLDAIVPEGATVALPTGDSLRLDGIGYYARLSLVDDGSIPLLYAALIVAVLGLTLAVAARQQIVMAVVIEEPAGTKLALKMRLWRNASSSRSEIESELALALGEDPDTRESTP